MPKLIELECSVGCSGVSEDTLYPGRGDTEFKVCGMPTGHCDESCGVWVFGLHEIIAAEEKLGLLPTDNPTKFVNNMDEVFHLLSNETKVPPCSLGGVRYLRSSYFPKVK